MGTTPHRIDAALSNTQPNPMKKLQTKILFLCAAWIIFSITPPRAKAAQFMPRDAVMFSAGVVNLALLGTIIWKATHKEAKEPTLEKGWTPNYNLSPSSREKILLEKL